MTIPTIRKRDERFELPHQSNFIWSVGTCFFAFRPSSLLIFPNELDDLAHFHDSNCVSFATNLEKHFPGLIKSQGMRPAIGKPMSFPGSPFVDANERRTAFLNDRRRALIDGSKQSPWSSDPDSMIPVDTISDQIDGDIIDITNLIIPKRRS